MVCKLWSAPRSGGASLNSASGHFGTYFVWVQKISQEKKNSKMVSVMRTPLSIEVQHDPRN